MEAAAEQESYLVDWQKGRLAPQVITPQNAYIVADMMNDVVRRGTGVRARRELGRGDLYGKTGTTNDRRDAWFGGFNADLVATAWVGFDQERSLGRGEEGAKTALPMWIHFMRAALAGMPEKRLEEPPGLVRVRISPDTGLLAAANDPEARFEIFREGHVPEAADQQPDFPLARETQDEDEEDIF